MDMRKYDVEFAVNDSNMVVEVVAINIPDARKKAWQQLIKQQGQLVTTHSHLLFVNSKNRIADNFGYPFAFRFENEELHISYCKNFFGESPDEALTKAHDWADDNLNPDWAVLPVNMM